MKTKSAPNGIMLYAKSSGPTSFSSLWSIKHALGTEKVGHTGTLDSFADGLLVVLTGNLTHLVPHVTGFTKTYEAIVCFGKETDTLDPTGQVIKTSGSVTKEQLENILPQFTGAILQSPPAFSALHIDGKRASDLVRQGIEVNLERRQVFIYALELLDFADFKNTDGCTYAKLKITCSKGTYIRSLARDIALALNSCAHLCALRRTQVGPFKLEDAACYSSLEDFTIANGIETQKKFQEELKSKSLLAKAEEKIFNKAKSKSPRQKDSEAKVADIKSHFLFFTKELAAVCGFESSYLKSSFEKGYNNGRPLSLKMIEPVKELEVSKDFHVANEIALFYKDQTFAGIIKKHDNKIRYGFVVPHLKKELKVYYWDEICNGAFPIQWKKKGSAITVGSFEAIHKGHQELVEYVIAEKSYAAGAVTFKDSIACKDSRNIFTLKQRLAFFEKLGLDFVIAIDFNEDFAKLSGSEFFNILSIRCNLKFLAEGSDFKCGYKGSCNMAEIAELATQYDFTLKEAKYIEYEGQKVSSSRIKEEIVHGNFTTIKEMLGRPFELALAKLRWHKKTDTAEYSLFESEYDGNQILPAKGTYGIIARFADGSILHTELIIENNILSIKLPTQKYADSLIAAEF